MRILDPNPAKSFEADRVLIPTLRGSAGRKKMRKFRCKDSGEKRRRGKGRREILG
jgi:hypothetical protein